MGIDVAHLVLEALGDTDDQVVDDGADGTESGNVLAVAMVNLETDDALLDDGEVDGDVAEVLNELAAGALDGNDPGLDRDLDCKPKKAALVICSFTREKPKHSRFRFPSSAGQKRTKSVHLPHQQLASPKFVVPVTHSNANSSLVVVVRRSLAFAWPSFAPQPSSFARAVDIAE